ncbi:MAG: fibronectin type III domain-containing protein [candidate division Zixibacteria bacterium]|nr:fibronectin type III domain-containing protein [candidate division Zixibacteria bacterium]
MGTVSKYIAILAIIVFLIGCSKEIDPPSGIAQLPEQPETPRGLTTEIGDASITINWTVSNPSAISKYMIYYTDDIEAEPQLLDSSTTTSYIAAGLTNGRLYFFNINAVSTSGIQGVLSSAISAVPGVFSISINNGAIFTNSRNIIVGLTAPNGTNLVQLSESTLFTDAHWEAYSGSKNITLSDNDGTKHIYARFQLTAGGISQDVFEDIIILDRVATIDSVVENSNGVVLAAGDSIRFSVYSSETGGEASITIEGLGAIELEEGFVASGAVYEIVYFIPIGTELVDAEISGSFADAAGNNAPQKKAVTRINATDPPAAVDLTGYSQSSLEILLEWTGSNINDFANYRIFRGSSSGVDETSHLVTTINNQSTVQYVDTLLADTTAYYYRVYVYDNNGNFTPSNEVMLMTMKNLAPDSITIAVTLTGDALSSNVTWQQATDDDFLAYHVMRSENDISAYNSDDVVGIINSNNTTSLVDYVPSASNYFYQVYVVDKQGLMTGSNVISLVIQ